MNNQISTIDQQGNELSLESMLSDKSLMSAMRNSIYPGAKDESISMVLSYCAKAGLDPLQKPVHIVPMSVKDSATGKNTFRDVVMPGIGLYRIQAVRTGLYVGMSEPEYGEDVTEVLDSLSVTYPAWVQITVKRMVDGQIAEFPSGRIRWKETYSTKNRDTVKPNSMWAKRPYGQLEKCAEAMALRRAFPEFGSDPTIEEMEGKDQLQEIIPEQHKQEVIEVKVLPAYSAEDFEKNFPAWEKLIKSGGKSAKSVINTVGSRSTLTQQQIDIINEIEVLENEAS